MATLFSGGLIFDGTESLVSDHAVLVENGIISELAPTSEFSGFDGEQVDFSGGTLMPGLFDCHVHLIFSGSPDPFQELNKLSAGDFTIRLWRMHRQPWLVALPQSEIVVERTIWNSLSVILAIQGEHSAR